jgi:hypothetical protein
MCELICSNHHNLQLKIVEYARRVRVNVQTFKDFMSINFRLIFNY